MIDEADRRRAERFRLALRVRFALKGGAEAEGALVDVSETGFAVASDVDARPGDTVIAYPEGLGRLVGKVARKLDTGFAVHVELSDGQRDMLRRRIAAAVEGVPYMRLFENRGSLRAQYNIETTGIVEGDAAPFDCVIVDKSQTGCFLRSDARPDIGKRVTIGVLTGIVRRHAEDGFGIEFVKAAAAAAQKSA